MTNSYSPSPEASQAPRLLTPRQVAATGILTEYAIRKGLLTGQIPAVRIGTRWRINYDLLLKKLRECDL